MSDALLTRIATALEALVLKAGAEVKVVAAEVVGAVEKVSKPRGRPVKGEENGVAVVPSMTLATAPAVSSLVTAAVAEEADPFALEPAAPAVKLELTDVRAALIAYQKTTSPEKARQKLKEFGAVDSLASLSPDKFAAVVASLK